ncbi:hypothetical protein QFZ80_006948 [Paenibacillus sp. V4I7]|nr:hypothetical protein [Paenibacillus sp. V4I7]
MLSTFVEAWSICLSLKDSKWLDVHIVYNIMYKGVSIQILSNYNETLMNIGQSLDFQLIKKIKSTRIYVGFDYIVKFTYSNY